jgi:UDP-glucose 4-epimerase
MKRVIITGANGFLGSTFIHKLVEKQICVVAIARTFTNEKVPDSVYIQRIETTYDSMESLYDVIPKEEYDAFYHFAWQGVNGLDKMDPIVQLKNVEMTINCASVAKRLGCKKYLCAGTIAEQAMKSIEHLKNASGGMMYGVVKHCTRLVLETYCKNLGLDFVWMQFSNIYGPCNKTGNLVSYTLDELARGREPTFGPADQPYDFIFVEDLIEAVFRLGEKRTNNNFYFIGSGEPKLLKEYLFDIGRIMGKTDLIKIGVRPDDGIKYTLDMFDTVPLKKDIGEYVSKSFTEGITYTLENYKRELL